MAENDSTTINPEKGPEQEPKYVPGPKTVYEAQDRLASIIAFAFLGKRAFMDGDYTEEGWYNYFSRIGCPFGQYELDGLVEMAFDELLRMASEIWQMLNDPADAIKGQPIDRTAPPAGAAEPGD